MATQILALPLLSFSAVVGTNEDWLDSWAYLDAAGNPISLAGLTLDMMMRPTPDDPNVVVVASTVAAVSGLPVNGAMVPGGMGGNVLSLQVPRATMLRVAPGAYAMEVQARGDGDTRTIASVAVTVVQGVVR